MEKERKRSAVSPFERLKWLEQLEKGEGITAISKAAGRDIRIVKRNIEAAMEERQLAHARRYFLLGVLEKHQKDLIDEAQRLRQRIAGWPSQLIPENPERKLAYEALREHIKRLPLRGLLEQYEAEQVKIEEVINNAGSQLSKKMKELYGDIDLNAILSPWASDLADSVQSDWPMGVPIRPEYRKEKREGGYMILWGTYQLTKFPVKGEKTIKAIFDAHAKLVTEAKKHQDILDEHRQRVRELSKQIASELAVLNFKRLIPGHCKYCPF